MKKIFVLFFVCMMFYVADAYAYNTPDLHFEKSPGKFIYCNNPENLTRDDLADNSNYNAKFIMNNEELTPDKYAMFISHYNHTEIMQDVFTIAEPGFDIELDVMFKAREDTSVRITSVGFEVPRKEEYWLDGKKYEVDSPIGCMNAWASYIKMPIRQLDSSEIYEPVEFTPVDVSIKKGEIVWLSEFIPGYCAIELYRAVHLLADFEIISGVCDVNIAAMKSTGTVGDRSNFNPNALFGKYKRDRQYKGIADNLNIVTADLDYTVDYNVYYGMPLPIKIYNNRYPQGNVTAMWHTHYNPSSETYDASQTDESNMLGFEYKDDSKLSYYGSNVKESEKSNIWYFDTVHNDLSEYINGCGNRLYFKPNTNDRYYGVGYDHCNLGNYGVYENYNFSMDNTTDAMRYAHYNIWASANMIVILYDENGNVVEGYPICKGYSEYSQNDTMACIPLPPKKTTDFRLTVILPTNYNGDIGNNMVIKTDPCVIQSYNTNKQYIEKLYNHTGEEFYKWEGKELYFSDDNTTWTLKNLDPEVKKAVYGNWKNASVTRTNEGYVVRIDKIGGIYFYAPQKHFRTIYYLDEELNMTGKHEFPEYASEFVDVKGVQYADMSAVYVSQNDNEWKISGSGVTMPVYNGLRFGASCKDKNISITHDGLNFTKVIYEGDTPEFIDNYANVYYFVSGNKLYVSYDGVYWQEIICKNKIKSLHINMNCAIINGSDSYAIEQDTASPVVVVDSQVAGYKNKPYYKNGVLMVPYEFTKELLGVSQTDSFECDNGYVPLRAYAESLGYIVEFDESTETAFVYTDSNIK